jgi:hypothetical protein
VGVKISPSKLWNNGLRIYEKKVVRGLCGPRRGESNNGIEVNT